MVYERLMSTHMSAHLRAHMSARMSTPASTPERGYLSHFTHGTHMSLEYSRVSVLFPDVQRAAYLVVYDVKSDIELI